MAKMTSAARQVSLTSCRSPEPGHPQHQRVIVAEDAFAHQAVGDRDTHVVDEALELVAGPRQQHTAAGVDDRALGLGEPGDDGARCLVVERRLVQRLGAVVEAGEQRRVDGLREDVHRHIDEHRPGLAVLGEQERLLDDLGEEFCPVDTPSPFHEWSIDLELRTVGVQVHLLVGVPAVVVGGHVAGDHHHGDAIERGIGDAGGRVGETRTEVAENDRGPTGDTRVAVGSVRGDLFVPHVDELDRAVGHGGENGDVGVSAQSEDVADAAPFQIADELFSSGWMTSAHCGTPTWPCGGTDRVVGSARWSGPR